MQAPRELVACVEGQRLEERFLEAPDPLDVLLVQELPDERRRIGIRAAEELQEILAAALLVARELERRDQHREEDLLAGKGLAARFALEAFQQLDALLVHGIEAPAQRRLEELLLAAE